MRKFLRIVRPHEKHHQHGLISWALGLRSFTSVLSIHRCASLTRFASHRQLRAVKMFACTRCLVHVCVGSLPLASWAACFVCVCARTCVCVCVRACVCLCPCLCLCLCVCVSVYMCVRVRASVHNKDNHKNRKKCYTAKTPNGFIYSAHSLRIVCA